MEIRKFKPVFRCRRVKSFAKELVSVRLGNGMYAILKYIDGNWKLGTLRFREKEKNHILQVNVFIHSPQWDGKNFTIGSRKFTIKNLLFMESVVYVNNFLHTGLIRKDYIKKMPAL